MENLRKELGKKKIKIVKTKEKVLTNSELKSLRKLTLQIRSKLDSLRREFHEKIERKEDEYLKDITNLIKKEILKIKAKEISENMLRALVEELKYYRNEASEYEKILGEATKDPLTGIYNKKMLMKLFNLYKSEAKFKKQKIAILMMDIDFFKKINDTYGHIAGDRILQDVSDILSRSIKDDDVLARYGGEEFVIILKDSNKKKAKTISERILKRIRDYNPRLHYLEIFTLKGKKKIATSWQEKKAKREKVTISIGVSLYPQRKNDKDALLRADEALYQSKKKGRDRVTFYE